MLEKIRKEIDKGYAKGMTIPQMAKAAGVSRNLPLMWYKGECQPTLKKFEALRVGIRKHKSSDEKAK
jgi:transcriptional regulator with XRE-family HTH domain